jgi:hypothetical protein
MNLDVLIMSVEVAPDQPPPTGCFPGGQLTFTECPVCPETVSFVRTISYPDSLG